MNPQNILREMLKIYEIGKVEDRKAIRIEAHQVLARDLVLRQELFGDVTSRLISLVAEKGEIEAGKEEGPSVNMLRYFVAELQHRISQFYIQQSLDMLKTLLFPVGLVNVDQTNDSINQSINQSITLTSSDRFDEIFCLTSHLLSMLIDNGASIEFLYTLYSQILVPRKVKSSSQFSRRYTWVAGLLTQDVTNYQVVLALDNVTSPQAFPSEIGGVAFAMTPPFLPMPNDQSIYAIRARKFLTTTKRKLFASLDVSAQDPRSAGAKASDSLNNILNLVRFEYERDRIVLSDSFAFIDRSRATRGPRTFNLPTVVPNPTAQIDGDGLSAFVKSVDELVLSGRFDDEGQDRVISAFRLYRNGLDTPVLENKLVSWWTAIEYLVRGNNGQGGGIGKSVETMLAPVLSRTYIGKHLLAFRSALLEMGVVYTDSMTGEQIAIKGMATDQLYLLFKKADFKLQVLPMLSQQTYMHEQFESFLMDLNDPKKLYHRNAAHEQRLKWQLQRLWRARCDIVHSAKQAVSTALLCANLEYYLKITLMSLLKDLRDIPTLSSPREFFDRQSYVYGEIQTNLQMGLDDKLLSNLAV